MIEIVKAFQNYDEPESMVSPFEVEPEPELPAVWKPGRKITQKIIETSKKRKIYRTFTKYFWQWFIAFIMASWNKCLPSSLILIESYNGIEQQQSWVEWGVIRRIICFFFFVLIPHFPNQVTLCFIRLLPCQSYAVMRRRRGIAAIRAQTKPSKVRNKGE